MSLEQTEIREHAGKTGVTQWLPADWSQLRDKWNAGHDNWEIIGAEKNFLVLAKRVRRQRSGGPLTLIPIRANVDERLKELILVVGRRS